MSSDQDSTAAPGSDFLGLDARGAPARGRTDWLTAALRTALEQGRLRSGDRLPATRLLAGDLGLSRGAVVAAYQRLAEQGLVVARGSGGTVVAGPPHDSAPVGASVAPAGLPRRPGEVASPAAYDLSPGIPDLSAFPRAAWLRAERAVLADSAVADLGYGDIRGHVRLRTELARWLARTRGLVVDADAVLVVAGVAQALALLWRVLGARGVREVAVEDPGSKGARDQLERWGMRAHGVPVDGEGIDVGAIPAGMGAVMLTPAHQFPTGVVLSPERRRALVQLPRGEETLLVEDDYDAEHRYDRAPVAALQGAAPDRVAHTGSTSKTLAPGMRLGWLVAPARLRTELWQARQDADLGSPALPQLVLARLLADGTYDAHLRRVRARQRQRRDAVVTAVRRYLPEARISGVSAGLHVLVLLPPGVDDVAAAERAASAGVVVHPLSWHRLSTRDQPRPGFVLGYAAHPPDRLHDAVRRIAQTLR